MRKIEIILTEENILKNTGSTVEQLAQANGYQTMVYIDGEEVANTQSCIDFLARKALEIVVSGLASPLLNNAIYSAQNQAMQSFNASLEAVMNDAEVRVTE